MKRRVAALRMIMARYLFRVLLSAALIGCGAAGAQAPVASADEARAQESAAQRLGSEWSVEGLETIVRSGNTRLVEAYERGFRQTAIRKSQEAHGKVPLPAAIESIIVAHYAEPGIGASLRRIFTASWVRYQTRPLFDLMYADWRSGKIRQGSLIMRDAILSTDLAGIEPQILDALEGLDPADGADGSGIVGFLAARKYLPAIPALVERERRAKPGRAAVLTRALLELGTPDAIEAVLERLAQASASAEPEARAEASWIAQQVASVPASIRIDFAAFRKALPAVLDAGQRGALLAFIASRNEGNGLGEVTGMLADPQLHRRALEVLVASDSVDVWRDARAAVEKLKADGVLDEGRYRSAAALLDGKIADPAKHFAEQRQAQRAKEFIARQQPIQRERHELEALRQTQPGRYVKDMPPLLEALAKLADEYADLPQARVGLRQEIANEYMRVGHVARFRLNRPAEGLASYEAASRNVEDMGAFAVADTWQFDLGDKAKALASYRRLLEANRAKVPSTNDIEAGAAAWQRRWLEAQIAWLERGERFAGPVTAEDIGTIGLLAVYGGDVSPTDDYFGLTELQRRARGRTQAD
ncbi:MAG TPA: hypothetical protein VFP36_02200, partial [Usitatibacter sp.]|nr:hypothetical protein [Usitatibacter sp.]